MPRLRMRRSIYLPPPQNLVGGVTFKMEELTLAVATSPNELQSYLASGVEERWPLGKCDAELIHAADPDGFFIGYLGEEKEKISYVNMITYSQLDFCYVGTFLVIDKHRRKGKGYGLKTWEYAWSQVAKNCASVSLVAGQDMAPKYRDKYGFEPAWMDHLFIFSAKNILSLPASNSSVSIIAYTDADFAGLVEYDTSVFGYKRVQFVKQMVRYCNGWAALNSRKDIVGYCAIKESMTEEYGWMLGPWYANDVAIAQSLLMKAAEFTSRQHHIAFSDVLTCVVPGVNTEGMKLARSLSSERDDYVRMFAKTKPEVIVVNSEKRVFALSSTGTG